VGETIEFAFGAARVFDLSKEVDKRGKRLHGNPLGRESGCLSRSQTFR
jgi:hypothetical protein